MIITCPSCKKKFEINENLVPDIGRLLKCGSCDQTWFYKKRIESQVESSIKTTHSKEYKEDINLENIDTGDKKIKKKNQNLFNKTKSQKNMIVYKNNSSSLSIDKIFSYLVVLSVSLIALFIVLETFKHPLYNAFPNEGEFGWYLWNLITLVKDILIFIRELIY